MLDLGSLISSLYVSRVEENVAALPEAARVASEDSIGKAQAVAAELPFAEGASLADSASTAFTDALGIGFSVAAAFAIAAAVMVWRRLPDERRAASRPAPQPALEGSPA